MGRRTPTGNWNGKCCWPVFAAQSPPISEGRQFFLSPGQGGDDLGIPADLNWAGRASETTLVTGPDGLLETIPADCLAMPGYRLEHTLTTGIATETVTVEVDSEYQIVIAGEAGAQVVCSGAITGTITADGSKRWTFAGDGSPETATTTSLVLTVTGALTELGVYPVTGRTNQNPPEYVSVGAGQGPGNSGIDGYKYFSTYNGNTVNPDGSINEGTGPALPGPLRLRLEPTATPVILHSNDFIDNAWWGNTRVTLTANATTGPDGALSGTYMEQESGQTDVGGITRGVNVGPDYVLSCHAKSAEKAYLILSTATFGTGAQTWFNLSTGTIGTIGAEHTDVTMEALAGGWYRCSVKSIGDQVRANAYLADNDNDLTCIGSGGIYLYGVGLEANVLTSYVETEGSLDPRAADAPFVWPLTTPQAEGMAVCEFEITSSGTPSGNIASFSTIANSALYLNGADAVAGTDGTNIATATVTPANGDIVAAAIRWSASEMQVSQYQGAWVADTPVTYDGAFPSDGNIAIGVPDVPMSIKTVSVYEEDNGQDWIEANFPL